MNRTNTTSLSYYLLPIGLPLLLLVGLIILTQLPIFTLHEDALAPSVTVDFILSVPLFYFLLIRKKRITNKTTVLWISLGVILASFLIPRDHQQILEKFKFFLAPLMELGVLTFLFIQGRRTVKSFKQHAQATPDFYTLLQSVTNEVLPKVVAPIFNAEIGMLYYSFFSWKKSTRDEHTFTYHKTSGTVALIAAFIFLILLETFIFHILLLRWSSIAAWILTGLSLYTGVQLFGNLRALVKRPILLTQERLALNYGMMGEAHIPWENIKAIAKFSGDLPEDSAHGTISPLKNLAPHNLVLHLFQPVTVQTLYGGKKELTSIYFYADEAEQLVEAIEARQKY